MGSGSGVVAKGASMEEVRGFTGRILVVEDEEFTRTLVTDGLALLGIEALSVASVSAAMEAVNTFDPHVVICDLNLGPGPSGAALLERIAEERPWVGLIALTGHASPELAIHDGRQLPASAVYAVKSQLSSISDLLPLASAAIGHVRFPHSSREAGLIEISCVQGDILRMIAEGFSNAGIAEARHMSIHAAESQVRRLFHALGIDNDNMRNQRVMAARMWQQGSVVVR